MEGGGVNRMFIIRRSRSEATNASSESQSKQPSDIHDPSPTIIYQSINHTG